MNAQQVHARYVEQMRLGAAGEADRQAAKSVRAKHLRDAATEVAAAVCLYVIVAVVGYLLIGAL